MTEEQQGGTAPEREAFASAKEPASEEAVGAVAVADEPAATSQTTQDETGQVREETASATSADAAASADAPEAPEAAPTAPEAEGPAPETVPAAPETAPTATDASTDDVSAEADSPDAPPAPAPAEPATSELPPAAAPAATLVDESDVTLAPAASDDEEPVVPKRELGPEPTTMEELLAEQDSDIKSFKHGDVVEGKVVRIDKDEMLVDIGAKSEGVVSNRELYGRHAETQPQLNIGDTVLVYVLQPESQEGHVVLSLRRAGLERKWRAMQEQFEAGVIIEAPVIDHNKGGLIVDCGIRGFVPISQIVDFPRRPQNDQPRDAAQEIAEKLQPFVGRKLRLKILEVNRKANRLILSEKVALYEERREKRDELFSSLQVSQRVTGTVRSIAPFGVFIDLGGIDGLVHKSELSWNKVNNPEAGYKVGDEVEAEVIDINHERGRISLSIRRLQPDPWHSTVADFNVGDVIDGTVTKLVNFGAFVRVRDGLEGLIHISELSHQRVAHPGDVVHEGQNLKLKIISLDSERHRLGLSLKQAEEPPARPAPEPGQPRPERRPRPERGYSMSDAVQEPEGGIDNTLAAAFAQVRQQVAASEEARAAVSPDEEGTAPAPEETAEASIPEAPEAPEAPAAAIVESPVEPETAPEPETAQEPERAQEPETAPEPETAAEPETAPEPEATTPATEVTDVDLAGEPGEPVPTEPPTSQPDDAAAEGALAVEAEAGIDAAANAEAPAPAVDEPASADEASPTPPAEDDPKA